MECDYKKAYENEGLALCFIDRLIFHEVKGAKLLTVYKCDECEMYHITSNPNYKKINYNT